jgi:peptide/nickel transport system substrate-binding protein
MTSADVKFSLERHLDPATASLARSEFEIIEKIEALDPLTVRIHLRQPVGSFLGILAWQPEFIVSENAVRKLGKQFAFEPVGTGPFYLDSWSKGQEIVLSKHSGYYAGPARVDRLVFKVIREELVALMAFGRKEIDVVPVRELPAYKAMAGREASFNVTRSFAGYYLLYVNGTKRPLNDVRVRRALSYALDRPTMYKALAGMIQPNPSIFSPVTFGHTRDIPSYDYDLARAKQLLTEAGYPNGFKIKINYSQAFLYEEFATMIKDQWTRLGLDATLEVVDRALVSRIRREKNYDVLPGSITRFEPEQHLVFFRGGASTNYTGYSNPAVDGLMDRAARELNLETRRKMLGDIQRAIAEDVPVIPLGAFQSIIVTRKSIKGVAPAIYEGMVDYYLVWVEE